MSIVVAYVANEHGEAALEAGIGTAKAMDTDLVVVNATKGDATVDPKFATADSVRSLDERLAETGLTHEIRQVMGRDLTDLVLEVVEEAHAQILVIGLRRRSPVGKLLLGSTAQRLLLDCPIPVLAVKA